MKRTSKVVAVLATVAGLLLLGSPAWAHGDEATIELESDEASDSGPLSVDLRVSLRYTGDDHLVEDAAVTVTGTGPDGATLAETPMEPVPETEGLFAAELTFPSAGAWALQVTSTEPDGELAVDVDVAEGPATTAEGEDAPTPTTVEPESDEGAVEEAEDDPDLLPILLGVLAVTALVVVVVALVLRRRKAQGIEDAR